MGTPNKEPQEFSRNIIDYKDAGRYIPIIFLLYSWGSLFGVPSKVPVAEGFKSFLPNLEPWKSRVGSNNQVFREETRFWDLG